MKLNTTELVALDEDLGSTKADVIASLAGIVAAAGRAEAAGLTADALSLGDEEDAAERVRLWAARHAAALAGLRATFGDLQGESAGLGQMWVLVRDLGLLTGSPE